MNDRTRKKMWNRVGCFHYKEYEKQILAPWNEYQRRYIEQAEEKHLVTGEYWDINELFE